ncbi:hypothetical protein J6590_019402 [Homalodisca vitripennis]|nr:hypothetical protein J6590_019402 [Homalodisca vitripennis]
MSLFSVEARGSLSQSMFNVDRAESKTRSGKQSFAASWQPATVTEPAPPLTADAKHSLPRSSYTFLVTPGLKMGKFSVQSGFARKTGTATGCRLPYIYDIPSQLMFSL